MTTNVRQNKLVINNQTTTNTGITSTPFFLGEAVNVMLFLKNTSANAATVTIQAAAVPTNAPGVNALSGLADSEWYTYYRKDETTTTIAVAGGANFAVDLSPIAASGVRLFVAPTTPGSQAQVTATIEANG